MAKDSVFNVEQKESIRIDKFIFHVIIADEDEPRYLDSVVLTKDQTNFFKKRFIEASSGTRFVFKNKETSTFYKECVKLFEKGGEDFVSVSKTLTASFNDFHKRTANDGIFIISTVNMTYEDEDIQIVFLIKMDNRAVYQYKVEQNQATFQEIINTVVEEKSAMQKVAIVDLSEHFSWDVLALERNKSDSVAGYFQDFLSVREMEPASTLTRSFVNGVKSWTRANRTVLPTGQSHKDYQDRATDYMIGNTEFDSLNFIDFVADGFGNDTEVEFIKNGLSEFFIKKGIFGASFTPKPNSLNNKDNRNAVSTLEGVRIEWFGTKESKNLVIPDKRNSEDNMFHIVIKTAKIENESNPG